MAGCGLAVFLLGRAKTVELPPPYPRKPMKRIGSGGRIGRAAIRLTRVVEPTRVAVRSGCKPNGRRGRACGGMIVEVGM